MTIHRKKSLGFTLTELIIMISIIGIIAALIAPQFVNLGERVEYHTLKALASNLTAASATNYQLSRSGSSQAISVHNCADVENTLPRTQTLPEDYLITHQPISGLSAVCEIKHVSSGETAQFIAYATP